MERYPFANAWSSCTEQDIYFWGKTGRYNIRTGNVAYPDDNLLRIGHLSLQEKPHVQTIMNSSVLNHLLKWKKSISLCYFCNSPK